MATPTPFRIAVPDDQLTWIQDRIRTARLPPARDLPPDQKWSFGLPRDVADQLQQHWVGGAYDWRRIEAGLNADLSMYTLPVTQAGADMTLHFVHHRSAEPDAIPLLFLHGWPGSFLEVQPVLGELVKPKMSSSSSSSSSSSPGDRAQAYHVVAPSLPGFGFSSYPSVPLDLGNMAAALNKLMLALGYDRYICQGGDWGSFLSRVIAHDHGDHCVGIHLNMVFATPPLPWKAPLACARVVFSYLTGWWGDYGAAMLKRMKWWWSDETGYFRIQGTKPLTLAYALVDSPFGQMCWIREKIENLVDDGFTWDNDTVITWAMIYILNGSSGPSEIYRWVSGNHVKTSQKYFTNPISRQVPVGVSVFPKDAFYAPRWWAAATVAENISFWREHQSGGHFPSVERPETLIKDIREFTLTANIPSKIFAKTKQS